MKLLTLVGPALRYVAGGVTSLAGKSDKNPKTSSLLTIMGMAAGWFGMDPGSLASIGSMLVKAGTLLQSIGATQ